MPTASQEIIAHVRSSDGEIQSVEQHLLETAEFSKSFASAIGLPACGKLLGLCHDLGKYSTKFQNYIRDGSGLNGAAARISAEADRGRIDHATAGAQQIWTALASGGKTKRLIGQILSVAVMSHHSRDGMKDFVSLDGKSPFLNRLAREEKGTFRLESVQNADPLILSEINRLLDSQELIDDFKFIARGIKDSNEGLTTLLFSYSLLTRFLFSCLLDADRLSTADFENRKAAQFRTTSCIPDWATLVSKVEKSLSKFTDDSDINRIRKQVSDECRAAADQTGNIFTLSVPTGGGKTLASLRFALHRASRARAQHPVERVIYVLPYTSIIDQNAEQVRCILGSENVLEHHSNLTPDHDDWRNSVLSENWDAPVVFTTSVQLLDSLFNQSTRSARRMHQLANSILIFDEIQALPVKAFHSFNNAINFLTTHANTTALLCTATMPLLHRVNSSLGALRLTSQCEIVGDKRNLFKDLKRTEVIDLRRDQPWTHAQIGDHALECANLHRSALVICNTKDSARRLFELLLASRDSPQVVHLSTSMCPAHRKKIIKEIKETLHPSSGEPLICVSTQLIEAGIDLDFGCVIRSLAGLDSIVQAGGRCNRHGKRSIGYVHVINFAEETLGAALSEIATAQQDTARVFGEFRDDPISLDEDLLSEAAMNRFYGYHFFKRQKEMLYPLVAGRGNPPIEATTSIVALLSENPAAIEAANREQPQDAESRAPLNGLELPLKQAFSTAARAFCVIDAPTQGVLVPYGDGTEIIADLAAAFASEDYPLKEQVRLLKRAQQFTVNCFPHVIESLNAKGVLREVQPKSGLYFLDERHYHSDLGITLEALSEQHYLGVN